MAYLSARQQMPTIFTAPQPGKYQRNASEAKCA